jgi:1,4-alpha-glucan branching enzyme
MNTLFALSPAKPYSAKNTAKPINFYFEGPAAKSVYLVGDFNDWDPTSVPMQRRVDGWWFAQVSLTHGHHHYLFLVDGRPTLDPRASGSVPIDRYAHVSVIAVS